jgi:uncharacterized protein YcbK (DUF882 family)
MGDLSEHYSRWEFVCNGIEKGICSCNQNTVDAELITILEIVSKHFGQRVHVNSGNRCLKYNRTLPGSNDTSQHLLSKAADIRVENVLPVIVYNFLTIRFPRRYGFGLYVKDRFVHVDSRSIAARW